MLWQNLCAMEPQFVNEWNNVSTFTDQEIPTSLNNSVGEEFPYWQLATALRMIDVVVVIIPIIIFLNCSVLFTFIVNKALHKPLNLVHVTVITELFLTKLAIVIGALFLLPDAIRYCICIAEVLNEVYFSLSAFNIAFVSVQLTCLSVIQFLYIKGKKKLVGWKVVGALVTGSTIYSLFLGTATFVNIRFQGIPLFCISLCTGVRLATFASYRFMLISLLFVVILPCLVIIFISLIWTCLIFKKSYIGGDNQLNRRMISLPVIMPLVTVSATVLYFIARELLQNILRRFVTSFYPNWVLVGQDLLGGIIEGISGFIYPAVLLYFHPQLRSSWKTMLKGLPGIIGKRCFGKKRNTAVYPETGESTAAS